jgi:hypothetical protein
MKLAKIEKKDVAEMTSLEAWAYFFKYEKEPGKRQEINEIIKK